MPSGTPTNGVGAPATVSPALRIEKNLTFGRLARMYGVCVVEGPVGILVSSLWLCPDRRTTVRPNWHWLVGKTSRMGSWALSGCDSEAAHHSAFPTQVSRAAA